MDKNIKIIDAFTFYNAVDVLKMRLQLHYPYVDEFYICEANYTYSGIEKEYVFEKHEKEFEPWADKIRYIKYKPNIAGLDFSVRDKELNFNFDSPAWIMEFGQRDELKKHIDAKDDDIVLVTDMDEFIDPKLFICLKLYSWRQDWVEARLNMPYFVNYMNCIWPGKNWTHPFLMKGKRFKDIESLSHHRHSVGMYLWFSSSGWHFNNLGGLDVIMDKFLATSHTEFVEAGVNDRGYVENCVKYCLHPSLDKKEPNLQNTEFGYLPLDVFPEELRKIMIKNPQFIITDLTGAAHEFGKRRES